MLIGQIVRYGLVGAAVTAFQEGVYLSLAMGAGWNPQLSNLVGNGVAIATGYFAHGRFSFRAHGPGVGQRSMAEAGRFLSVALAGLAINAFWVWLTVGWLRLPVWAPVPLKVAVTPAFIFVLNRSWVYRGQG